MNAEVKRYHEGEVVAVAFYDRALERWTNAPAGAVAVAPAEVPERARIDLICGLFRLSELGESVTVATCASGSALSRFAFDHGAEVVRHDYDLRKDDAP